MIWKFQPFSTTKEIGKEYNSHCSLVPNPEDWILILDYDAMILIPETYQVIERAIQMYPEAQMFGAMTNRVGLSFQRITNVPDENDSIRHHIQIAKERAHFYSNGECKDVHYIAGFFMLFRKSYWMEHPFQDGVFNERGNLFDYEFCKPLRNSPGSVKVIQGAYVFHKYRIDKENYRMRDHLK